MGINLVDQNLAIPLAQKVDEHIKLQIINRHTLHQWVGL